MIGRHLSHYEVLEELGRGGMGVVYKAHDTSLGRFVALKLLPPRLAENLDRIELLRREAQASARLNHPRIVTIYTVEEAEGHLFLTMEYVEGRTLDKAIPRHGFDLERFFKIAIPLADALGTAHDQQIVHRDLKPANIMLSRQDRPKILDFGLARLRPGEPAQSDAGQGEDVDSEAATQMATLGGRLAGTVPYMSPEQLNRGPVDHRTDIFSLGVIYYEMATGSHPYRSGEGSIATSILEDRPVSVADVRTVLPRQLGRIIGHCLEKDPEGRVQSAKDLRNDLEDLQRELANPGGRGLPTRAARLRRVGLPALLSAAILATAGWLLYDRFTHRPPVVAPHYMAVEQTRIFPGERGPDYLRRGVLDSLRRRLTGLEGIYILGEQGPNPDFIVQADARKSGETVALSFRLLDSERNADLGDGVFEGSAGNLPDLVERAGRSVALALDRQPDLNVDYRFAAPPTTDAVALDLYLQAAAATGPNGGSVDTAGVHHLLERALERDPKFALAYLLAGQKYLEEHRAAPAPDLTARAESLCRSATETDPNLGAAFTCLGEALMLADRTMDAVEALRRAIALDTSDLTPRSKLREAYRDLPMRESAKDAWEELIETHPSHWAGYYSLGRYYQDAEQYEDALAQYTRALELAPRAPDLHRYLGTVHVYLGRFEEAEVALRNSIKIRPTWDAYYNLGGLYFNLRRFVAAVAAYEEAVRLDESDYRSRGRLGWACFWAPGRRQEAPEHLRRAIELAEPEDPDARILTALFHAMLGEREPSLEALRRALELRPNDSHYFYLAGVAMNHLGDTDAALDWLRQAVSGGFSTAEIRNIIDLENLIDDPRFQQLMREADAEQS